MFLQEQMSVLKGKGREEKLSAFPSSLADWIWCPVPQEPNGLNLLLRQMELVLSWLRPWQGHEDVFHNSSSCQEQQQQQHQKPVETVLCSEQKTHARKKNSLNEKVNVISPDKPCKPEAAKWWKRRGEITQYLFVGKCKWVISCLRTKCSLVGKAKGQAWLRKYWRKPGRTSCETSFLEMLEEELALLFSCCKENSWDFLPSCWGYGVRARAPGAPCLSTEAKGMHSEVPECSSEPQ